MAGSTGISSSGVLWSGPAPRLIGVLRGQPFHGIRGPIVLVLFIAVVLITRPHRRRADRHVGRDGAVRARRKLAEATGAVTAIKVSAVAVDARIRVTSHRLADPFLRQLPE